MTARLRMAGLALGLLAGAACAARGPVRPAGSATDDPRAVTALAAATAHCRPLRTATGEIRLSGRAGRERLRVRLLAGFAEPAAIRLEALAPFGAPGLILASDGGTTTLLFPRDRQVLRDGTVPALLEALTGLTLDAAELRRLLLGCLAGDGGRGRAYGGGWQMVEAGDTRSYLRDGVLAAADYRGWQIDYGQLQGGVPRQVRVRRASASGDIDLTAVIGDLTLNTDIDPRAFALDVPSDAASITLDDLRRASPFAPR